MWDRFSKVYITACTKYKDRIPGVLSELDRIGVPPGLRHVHVEPCESVFTGVLKSSLSSEEPVNLPCSLNHYGIIRTSYEMGYAEVLVVEDDIRFLKDLGLLRRIVSSMPDDYDLALFDKHWPGLGEGDRFTDRFKSDRSSFMTNEHWFRFDFLYSRGCYAMSWHGMERWLNVYETAVRSGRQFKNGDNYLNRKALGDDAKLYAATPSAALQVLSGAHAGLMDHYYTANETVDGSVRGLYAEA